MMNAANNSLLNLLQPMMGQAAGGDVGLTPEQMMVSLEEAGVDSEFWSLLNQQLTGMIQQGELQLTENTDLIALIEAVEQTAASGEPIQLDPQLMMQLKSHFQHGEPVRLTINEAGEVELVAGVEPDNTGQDTSGSGAISEAAIDQADKTNPAVAAMINDQAGERLPPGRQSASAADDLVKPVQDSMNSPVGQQPDKSVAMNNPDLKEAAAKVQDSEQAMKSAEAVGDEDKTFKLKLASETEGDVETAKQSRQSVVESANSQTRPDINAQQAKIMTPVAGLSASSSTLSPHGTTPTASALPVLTLSQTAESAEWGQAIGERVSLLINQKLNHAEIRIDPPHLGKLDIQVQLNDDKAIVNIQTQQAQTRDLVDSASVRLREFLQEAGYQSVDVNVSHREQSPEQQMRDQQTTAGNDAMQPEELSDDPSMLAGLQQHHIHLQPGRIDYFA